VREIQRLKGKSGPRRLRGRSPLANELGGNPKGGKLKRYPVPYAHEEGGEVGGKFTRGGGHGKKTGRKSKCRGRKKEGNQQTEFGGGGERIKKTLSQRVP